MSDKRVNSVVPHNECVCDGCMIKYYKQGLIHEGTPAYDEVMVLLKNIKTSIISGFPGVGKSMFTKQSHLIVLDSDSSQFSWTKEGERNPDFPNNYMQHIKELIGKAHYILVSSHEVVRKALIQNDISYISVYPSVELVDEYLERYKKRGNDEKFIEMINGNWERFIADLEQESYPIKIKLNSGEYLSDVLNTDLSLSQQLQYAVEALKWYAVKWHYELPSSSFDDDAPALVDCGKKARSTLHQLGVSIDGE